MEAGGFTKAFPTFWKEKKLKFEKKSFFVTEKWPLASQSVASFLCVASTWNFYSFVDKKKLFLVKETILTQILQWKCKSKVIGILSRLNTLDIHSDNLNMVLA